MMGKKDLLFAENKAKPPLGPPPGHPPEKDKKEEDADFLQGWQHRPKGKPPEAKEIGLTTHRQQRHFLFKKTHEHAHICNSLRKQDKIVINKRGEGFGQKKGKEFWRGKNNR